MSEQGRVYFITICHLCIFATSMEQCTCTNTGHLSVLRRLSVNVVQVKGITGVCTINKSRFIFALLSFPAWPISTFFLAVIESYCTTWSHSMTHTHTHTHTHTLGRTPLNQGSAHCRDLYLTTHKTHNRHTSMPPAGFELAIPARERQQTQALDSVATEICIVRFHLSLILGNQTNDLRPGNKCHSLSRVAKYTSCGNAITMTRQIFGECTWVRILK
jgi:hypothetical protein